MKAHLGFNVTVICTRYMRFFRGREEEIKENAGTEEIHSPPLCPRSRSPLGMSAMNLKTGVFSIVLDVSHESAP